ncbi:nucleosome assembly protein 1-like 1-B [Scaptodrosophila lebanonensis]|uniref:Nucleosome assembly protein 1-like 1-B n=1 Tax=Drosophila lebanonensis TaxID=7225 RepID=A0A6J2TLD5_DROLE|nr:nucleosome assembly protein 1-like 1-B [Scaptodrosophila lebanonensis]
MDAPPEGNIDTESCNELEDEKSTSDCHALPAYMTSVVRRQFLQEMIRKLPENVQNRIVALKNLQLEHLEIEAKFFNEVYNLEKAYQQKYIPLFTKRTEIITGAVDPPKEEPKWKEPADVPSVTAEGEAAEDITEALKNIKNNIPQDAKGIPDFWLTVFRNTVILSEMVQDHDEPVLRKLTDITIKYDDEHSYFLEFHFDKNEYFSNPVLTKQYFLKATVDPDDPFAFEGPEIYKCKGCVINWEKKMNLTVKTIRKKQKHKERGAVRTIVKQVPTDSFFNFFNPPEIPTDKKEEVDEESQQILATDFEIGHFLRARIIPKAILYYTGDIVDDEDDEDEEEYDENEEDDSEYDDANEGQVKHVGNKKKQNPNDCPNQ